jgi:tripartite-type tricarboxylate transporter receptor subunit TctC
MIVVLVLLCPASHVAAQEADPFFKGKTVTIAIGSSTGGGLDTYGRLVARHLGKHIPGNPTVVPSNMPGAGGNIVAGNLYAVAPKDGTFMGLTFPGVIVDPLLSEAARKTYDATKFNYVGNAHSEILVCLLRNDAKAKTPGDLLAGEVILGATAPGSTTFDFPTIANSVLGTKLKIITGYKGSREVTLAIEKGEVQGICGLGWSTVKVQLPEVLSGTAYARVLAQEDMQGHPVLNQHGVPLMTTLARTDDDRQVLQMFYGQSAFARPFILPPGIPHDRLALLRKAFNETMRDPELLAEAEKMKIDVVPSTGERVQELVARMYQTPVPVIERVKKALGRNK